MTIAQPKLLVIGDYCIDETIIVESGKQNPENTSPLYNVLSTTASEGMSANVVECLKSLGLTNITYLKSLSLPIKKTRIYNSDGTPICRLDEDLEQNPIVLKCDLSDYDCIVISDYDKGAVTDHLINWILAHSNFPVFLDTKKRNLASFEGCVVKINQIEYNSATSIPSSNLIVTLGSGGCVYKGNQYLTSSVPVKDVCGAGDAFLAGLVYGWLKHKTLESAIPYGLKNATISVQHLGCYRPSEDELLEEL